MRARTVLLAALPTLWLALPPGAVAQPNQGPPMPNMPPASDAPANRPTAANPNPMTPSPRAPDMQTYVGMLQKAADDLRREIPQAESSGRTTQAGAMSPALIQLMQAMREARSAAERAPESFTDNPVFKDGVREMRERFTDITSRQEEQPRALDAARSTLAALERIRQAAGS
ncbi:hypothetical protein [Roseomonas indoligenes]|uniref:Uncharacterized protein n=1 Tax=Roseomonas indoligenes TaxID=2820811 RepID=A0A940S3N3_9PROT|nr:hypothetical protein [Pararoseomonas indoligenes]MBP0491155.1 hypothetical protein [Pararoseomonas indoligenes]